MGDIPVNVVPVNGHFIIEATVSLAGLNRSKSCMELIETWAECCISKGKFLHLVGPLADSTPGVDLSGLPARRVTDSFVQFINQNEFVVVSPFEWPSLLNKAPQVNGKYTNNNNDRRNNKAGRGTTESSNVGPSRNNTNININVFNTASEKRNINRPFYKKDGKLYSPEEMEEMQAAEGDDENEGEDQDNKATPKPFKSVQYLHIVRNSTEAFRIGEWVVLGKDVPIKLKFGSYAFVKRVYVLAFFFNLNFDGGPNLLTFK